ncbi:alpha/beta fold hydrolase [Pseudonocardia bannensis]|uniref:Alpha/beta fold hydrolase n=1 Tax=Pseudonocardia bannensis TaxID=630973 RepID=A0A848DLI8_9PSEU|nr:alpha/beta fold hydrolase [Pseudonocardia bannensis]NMH93617.1 alpha/beta fold hydrolase [Pseudonocardia bannensis]
MAVPDEGVRVAGGVRLHVEVDGPADAPVTVLLAHGWTLDARSWGPVAARLTSGGAGPRVIRYDHRGHGRSDAVDPDSMTLEQLADDLAELIEKVAPEGPLVLGGHSMGGMTLMALAERHPDLVCRRAAGVALVATASGGTTEGFLGLAPRPLAAVQRGEARLYGSRWWARRELLSRRPGLLHPGMRWLLLGPRPDREALRITAQCIAGCRPATLSGFRPTLEAHERDAVLAVFAEIPTTVLAGSRDRLTPVRASRRIAAALPTASLTIFPEAGHMLPVERPAGVAARIAALAHNAAVGATR